MNTSKYLTKFLLLTAVSTQMAVASSEMRFEDEEGNELENVRIAPSDMRLTPHTIEVQGEIFSHDRSIGHILSADDGRRMFLLEKAWVYRTLAQGFDYVIGEVPPRSVEAMPNNAISMERMQEIVMGRRVDDVRNLIEDYLTNQNSSQN